MKSFILILLLFIPLNLFAACPSGACYVAPMTAGMADCSSAANACLMATALATVAAGNHIWMGDGTYTGANSMIVPPDGRNGTAGSPITISAINDGAVTIDGEGARVPVWLQNNDYFILEGFNAHSSNDGVVQFGPSADHNTLRRVCAWDASVSANTDVIFDYGGTYTLLEDVCAFGTGRKVINGGTSHLTARRVFALWNKTTSAIAGATVCEFGYESDHILFENVICTADQDAGATPVAFSGLTFSRGTDTEGNECGQSQLLGSITYLTSIQTPPTGLLTTYAGLWMGQYNDCQTLRNNVTYVEPVVTSGNGIIYLADDSYATATGPQIYANGTEIGASFADSMIGSTWTVTNRSTGANVAAVPNIWNGAGTSGARVCYRYIDGVLSSTPLWPWPMNQRIIDAMTAASRTPIDVTASMETVFGTIPADCRGGTPTFPLTLITHASAGSTDQSNVTTTGVDTTGADLLTMEVALYNDLPICTPSDSKSNAWTALTAYGISGDQRVRIYYSPHPTVGASHTFTCNGTSLAPSIAVQAWSGAAVVPFDVQNGGTDTNVTGVRPGNVTPTTDGALIVTAVSASPINTTLSIDSGFTSVDAVNYLAGSHYGLSVGYKLVATPAINNPTWTGDTSLNNWATDIAVFKSGATFAGPAPSVFNSPVFRPRVFSTKN